MNNYYIFSLAIKTTYYFSCCRDGEYWGNPSQRKTDKKRPHQKPTRKLNAVCLSRMYVDEYHDHHVEVTYITAHTNHDLGPKEIPHLPLPKRVKEKVAGKVNKGIASQRILEGMYNYKYLFYYLITQYDFV